MTIPSDDLQIYVPVYDVIPDEWEDGRNFLMEKLRLMSDSINRRDFGFYIDREILNGQVFIPGTSSQEYRQIFRKVINLGGLNNFTITNPQTVAHGITTNTNTFITRIYGAATDPGASSITAAFPLPHYSSAGRFLVLEMDATNIIITAIPAFDWSAYTRAYVVVEYVQQA